MQKHVIISAALVTAALLGAARPTKADEKTFQVRQTMPRWIVWWLDVAHQPVPFEIQMSRAGRIDDSFPSQKMPQETMFTLPVGVEKLTADDPHNSVKATGTPDALAELGKQIAALDQPLKQVEIEATIATVDPVAMDGFAIDFHPIAGESSAKKDGANSPARPLLAGAAKPDYLTLLKALEQKKQAKIVSAPRVTAINYLPASIRTTVATPITLPGGWDGLEGDLNIYGMSSFGVIAMPVIQPDESVLLTYAPSVDRSITVPADGKTLAMDTSLSPWKEESETLATPVLPVVKDKIIPLSHNLAIATSLLRDGDIVALTGFAPPSKVNPKDSKTWPRGKTYVLFLTSRTVHRQ